jgi:hypothetical protein
VFSARYLSVWTADQTERTNPRHPKRIAEIGKPFTRRTRKPDPHKDLFGWSRPFCIFGGRCPFAAVQMTNPFRKNNRCLDSHCPPSVSVALHHKVFRSQRTREVFFASFRTTTSLTPLNSKLSLDMIPRQKHRLRYICLILVFYYERSLLRIPICTSIRSGKSFNEQILNAHPRHLLEFLVRRPVAIRKIKSRISENSNQEPKTKTKNQKLETVKTLWRSHSACGEG